MKVRTCDLSPQDRDRRMQTYLAQARGVVRNGDLLRQAVDRALRIQAAKRDRCGETVMEDALVESLGEVVRALENAGATYVVTGSIASSVHGEPFASIDLDLLVEVTPDQGVSLATTLSPRIYAPQDMLAEAAERGGLVHAVENRVGLKIGLWFVGGDSFLRQVLRRRMRLRLGSHPEEYWFVTPEDIILMKLVWCKETPSAKEWENALGVARVRGTRMDWKYVFESSRQLGIEDDLIKLRDAAGI